MMTDEEKQEYDKIYNSWSEKQKREHDWRIANGFKPRVALGRIWMAIPPELEDESCKIKQQ